MRLIDADALYEKTAEWEARALSVIEKLNRKPFEEMDSNEITEWRKWSCILNERSAFKHDVADAPTVEPQQWIPVTEKLPKEERKSYWVCTDTEYQCECRWTDASPFWSRLTAEWHWNIFDLPQYTKVVAWMPLPEPYRGGEEECH